MDLQTAVKYVAAAYLVVWAAIMLYMLLLGSKLNRIEGELDALEARLDAQDAATGGSPAQAPPAAAEASP